jgi:hypothetical protein
MYYLELIKQLSPYFSYLTKYYTSVRHCGVYAITILLILFKKNEKKN